MSNSLTIPRRSLAELHAQASSVALILSYFDERAPTADELERLGRLVDGIAHTLGGLLHAAPATAAFATPEAPHHDGPAPAPAPALTTDIAARPHIATVLTLASLGWHLIKYLPDLDAQPLWTVVIERFDQVLTIARKDAVDPDAALAELAHYAAAGAPQ